MGTWTVSHAFLHLQVCLWQPWPAVMPISEAFLQINLAPISLDIYPMQLKVCSYFCIFWNHRTSKLKYMSLSVI